MVVLQQGEVEPSTAMMTCTHSSVFNMDKNVVDMCQKSQDKLGCITNNVEPSTASSTSAPYVIRCIWNECSQAGTPGCPSQDQSCESVNGPSAPGYCLRTTAKIMSTQENSCTHKASFSMVDALIQECSKQSTEQGCSDHQYCMWNKKLFNEPPTTEADKCTHKSYSNFDETKVKMCKSVTTQAACQQDGCVWNMPKAVVPSQAENTCTHTTVDA